MLKVSVSYIRDKMKLKLLLGIIVALISISFVSAIDIDDCMTITSPGTYVLTTSISSDDTCIDIQSSNVDLDCQGNTISSSKYAIRSSNNSIINDVTIENCILSTSGSNPSIYFYKATDISIEENTFTSNSDGISFNQVNNSLIQDNTITINSASSDGVNLYNSNNNIANFNTITTNLNYSYGFYLSGSSSNNITSNSIDTNGIQSHGIFLKSSEDNILTGSSPTTYLMLNIPKNVTYGGDNYTIEIVGANSEANAGETIILDVNGVGKTVAEKQATQINGLYFYVTDLFITNIPTLSASANIFLGSKDNYMEDNTFSVSNGEDILDVSGDTQAPTITYDSISAGENNFIGNSKWINLSFNEDSNCIQTDYYSYQINDSTPPQISNYAPTGSFGSSSTFTISFNTNERSTCRASLDSDESYNDMDITFDRTEHSITNYSFEAYVAATVGTHSVFVKCVDFSSNLMTESFNWSFEITSVSGMSSTSGSGGGYGGGRYNLPEYSRLYDNLTAGNTYLINMTCYDRAGNSVDTYFDWDVISDFNISITSPAESVLIKPFWRDANNLTRYNSTISFTTNTSTTCAESTLMSSISSPPSCTPSSCNDLGCTYVCSSSGGGGGGSGYSSLNENLTTTHSFEKSLSNHKYTHNIKCTDAYDNIKTNQTIQYVAREDNITIEWAKIQRATLSINQSVNFISSITNYYDLTSVNFTLTLPSQDLIYHNYSVSIGQGFDERFDKNFQNTSQAGNYTLNVSYYDSQNNSQTESLSFVVYGSELKEFNTTAGDYNFTVRIKDPNTGEFINTGNSSGGQIKVPKAKVDIELEPTNNTNSLVTLNKINLSQFNIFPNGIVLNSSNVTDSSKSLGNGTGFRYLPLNAEAIEVVNFSQFNTSAIYKFDYSNLSIADSSKIVIFKSEFSFNSSSINYSSGHFYKLNDPLYPLFLNETGQYVYINITSFSSFIITEDQYVAEICNNNIDDDFDGDVDEDCYVAPPAGGGGGGSSGGGLPAGNVSVVSKTIVVIPKMNKDNETTFEILNDALSLYESTIKVKETLTNVEFTFTKLNEKPEIVSAALSEEILFKYLEISHTTNSNLIEEVTLKFKIEKEWLNNNSVEKESIKFYRYTNFWKELETKILKEDAKYIYFEAKTPGFSYFKISGNKKIEEIEETTEIVNSTVKEQNDPLANLGEKIQEFKESDDKVILSLWVIAIIIVLLILVIIAVIYKRKSY